MTSAFFDKPILNSPDDHPVRTATVPGLSQTILQLRRTRRPASTSQSAADRQRKAALESYWVPGVNNLKTHGRWGFVEFTDVFQMQEDFGKRVAAEFERMLASDAA